jgi:hypothetical protein
VRVETSRGGYCAGRGLYCLCTRRVSHPGGTQMYSYRPSLSHHSSRNKGSDHPSSLTQSSPHGYPTIDIVHSHVQGTRYRQHVHVALPASDQLLHVEVCVIQLTCVSNDCWCLYSEQRYDATWDVVRSIGSIPSRQPPEIITANPDGESEPNLRSLGVMVHSAGRKEPLLMLYRCCWTSLTNPR